MKKLIALLITFIFLFDGAIYGLRVPLVCNKVRSITKSDVARWVKDVEYWSLAEYEEGLETYLNKDGPAQWPGGDRYGTVKAVFKVYPLLVSKLKIEVHPEDEWRKGFDEMRAIKKYRKRINNDFNHGGFGQVVIELYQGSEGRNLLLISEVQPSGEFRRLSVRRRHYLDIWRRQAIDKVIKWAEANNFLLFATHPNSIRDIHDRSEQEIVKNYAEPFADTANWVVRKSNLINKSRHILNPLYVYVGNPKIEANIRAERNKASMRSVPEKLKSAKRARNKI